MPGGNVVNIGNVHSVRRDRELYIEQVRLSFQRRPAGFHVAGNVRSSRRGSS